MTIQEFLNKWGYQSAVDYGSAQFDCRDNLKKDLDELMKDSFKAGRENKRIYNPEKDGELEIITIIPEYKTYENYLKTLE